MKLLFVHGWSFDSSIWDGLATRFADCCVSERGYFGPAGETKLDEPFLAVTHSFGTMRFLADIAPACRGIVAINGFDRFTALGSFPGVPTRTLDRMIARFGDAPEEVLTDFRQRCGCDAPLGAIDNGRLLDDLIALRDGDQRTAAAQSGLPILSLQGTRDPVLPLTMREAVFASTSQCDRLTHGHAGHLLPLEDAAYCANAISAFMERLT